MSIIEIDKDSAHRIASGQVITNIASAVKELIENSLDAHSTSIEIRFRNSGLAGIEVIDNGDGVATDDFAAVALKHHTSKLEQFEDLEQVKTLGFRGEALNSLCAMADVEMTTSQADSGLAAKLIFDHEGNVKQQSKVAGRKGTHVIVNNLFHNLPVRRFDLEKNIKREFSKAVGLLQSYALISSGVKIMVTQIKSGSRSVILATHGTTIDEHIVSIFGSGSLSPLTSFDLHVEYEARKMPLMLSKKQNSRSEDSSDQEPDSQEEEICDISDIEDTKPIKTAEIQGYISKPVFGQGRSSSDRQLLFVNGRPCVIPRLLRAVSEAYKQFNTVQVPCIFADLRLDTKDYDVNVSPDKRTILLHNEEQLIEATKEVFLKFFAEFGHTVPSQQVSAVRPFSSAARKVISSTSSFSSEQNGNVITNFLSSLTPTATQTTERNMIEQIQTSMTDDGSSSDLKEDEMTLVEDTNCASEIPSATTAESAHENSPEIVEIDMDDTIDTQSAEKLEENEMTAIESDSMVVTKFEGSLDAMHSDHVIERTQISDLSSKKVEDCSNTCHCTHSHDQDYAERMKNRERLHVSARPAKSKIASLRTINEHAICKTSIENIKENWKRMNKLRRSHSSGNSEGGGIMTINIPEERSEEAEKRLNLVVQKGDFLRMRVVGQFNRGFILVTRPKATGSGSDLFIVDQHASDEKYNFEQYQKDIVMERQPLVVPQRLKVSVVEELMIQNHRDILTKNGFNVEVDDSALPGTKCSLTTLPTSKSTVFNTSDFYELLYLIGESPENKSLRCSKVRSMLAMRACRTSIMIGDPLDLDTMRKVVRHLAALDKPWNCPHGRPTLRHLTQVSKKKGFFDDILVEG